MKTSGILLLWIAGMIGNGAGAMAHRPASDHKTNQYLSDGVFVGGRSGTGFTLLDVRRSFDKKSQGERIVLDWGDDKARPLKGRIGFFHVGIDKRNRRMVVDLSQVTQSRLDEAAVTGKFKNSPLVKRAQMVFDPIEGSTQLILDFKSQMAVEAFYLIGEKDPTRLVLDVRPLKTAKRM
jgi:hypothetical protein